MLLINQLSARLDELPVADELKEIKYKIILNTLSKMGATKEYNFLLNNPNYFNN